MSGKTRAILKRMDKRIKREVYTITDSASQSR